MHNNNLQSQLSRVIVFYDMRQVPATVPLPSDLLLVQNNVRTPLNPSYSGRFKVIHDQMYWTNSLAYTLRDHKNYYNLQIPIRYTGSGPTTLCQRVSPVHLVMNYLKAATVRRIKRRANVVRH